MKSIPDYFFPHIDEAVRRFNDLPHNASFFFTTDVHYRDNAHVAVPLIAYFAEKTDVKKLFSGGDYPFAFGAKEECISDTKKSLDYLAEVKPLMDFYSVRGNHDITIKFSREEQAGYTYPKSETNALILSKNSPVTAQMPEEACFFVDYPEEKIRYVAVNTSDSQSDDCNRFWGVHYSIGAAQLKWIAENAFSFPEGGDGWLVIVIGHIPCIEQLDAEGAPKVRELANLLADFKNKRKGKYGDFIGCKAELAAYLCGHIHADVSAVQDGVLHISTGSEAYYHDDIWERKLGTVSETLFDVFTIDRSKRKIHAVRVGAGKDRVFDY